MLKKEYPFGDGQNRVGSDPIFEVAFRKIKTDCGWRPVMLLMG